MEHLMRNSDIYVNRKGQYTLLSSWVFICYRNTVGWAYFITGILTRSLRVCLSEAVQKAARATIRSGSIKAKG